MNGQTTELVVRARGGDRGAFGELVAGHWEALVRLARSVVGDGEAEDAVQDGLVAAWRRLGSVRDPEAFRPWVTTVVARGCLRRARRRALLGRRFAPLAEAGDPAAPGTEGGAAAAVDVPRLLAALAPRQRAVLHLTVVEGMSDSEIGRALGITAASVRSHRRRARQRLDQLLLAGPAGEPLPSGGSTP